MRRRLTLLLPTLFLGATACSDSEPAPVIIPDLEFVTTSVATAAEGEFYEADIVAKGGALEKYRWAISDGALPNGVFLSPTNVEAEGENIRTQIRGTVTSNGQASFTVRLTDQKTNKTLDQEFVIVITDAPAPLAITTESLPDGGTDVAYSATLEASSGTAPYVWALAGGALPPGLSVTGDTLTGTPVAADSYSFTLEVTDEVGAKAMRNFTVTIQDNSLPLRLVTTDLDDGERNLPYTQEITAENGAGGYTWLITDAPPGLTISAEGNPAILSGTPTMVGSYVVTIEVMDAAEARQQKTYFIDISREPPPLRIVTLELPDGEQNTPYSANIEGVNGSETGYVWSATGLPPGLALTPNGPLGTTLSGSPTASGAFAFTVQLADDRGVTHSVDYSINIIDEILPLVVNTSTNTAPGATYVLPRTRLGEPYSIALSAQGGFGEYNWLITEGSMPAGLNLELAGTPSARLVGIAGQRGTFTATVTVYDWQNSTASLVLELEVLGPLNPVELVTTSVTDSVACNPYQVTLTAQNGSAVGYMWTLTSGSLPPGLTMDTDGTPSTQIRGVPSTAAVGNYSFTVQVQDSSGDVSAQAMTMTVVDDGTGDRWMVMVGDATNDNRNDVYAVNVCDSPVAPGVQVSPLGLTGDADTGTYDYAIAANGSKIAFIGDFNIVGRDEAWVVDLSSGAPSPAVRISPASWQANGDVFTIKISDDGNRVAFNGDGATDNINEIWVADTTSPVVADNAVPVNQVFPSFTDVDTHDFWFSPDSSKMVFTADTNSSSSYESWFVDLATVTTRTAIRISDPLPNTSADVNDPPVWTPDSNSVFFNADSAVYNRDELWIVDLTNPAAPGNAVQLSGDQGSGDVNIGTFDYGITDDGLTVWYISDARTSGEDEIFVVSVSSPGNATPVHASQSSTSLDAVDALIEPGGTRLLVKGDLAVSSRDELFIFDLAGPFPQPLTSITTGMQPNGDVSYTAVRDWNWSPDGNWVAFISDFTQDGQSALFAVDASGASPGPVVRVSGPQTNTSLDVYDMFWSPASDAIASYGDMTASSRADLYVSPIPAPGQAFETFNLTPNMPTSGDVSNDVSWSADGTRLFFRADLIVDNNTEIFMVDSADPTFTPQRISPMLPANGDMFGLKTQ